MTGDPDAGGGSPADSGGTAFKELFSPAMVRDIARHLARRLPGLDAAAWAAPVLAGLDVRELKARALWIADHLHHTLPGDPAERAEVLRGMLRASGPGLSGWAVLPLTLVVGQHGIADFDRSLDLLRVMTTRFSSEFGIRYLLLADQDRALATLGSWVGDPDHHVRRLVSEGTRPRLPWAMQLPRLRADPSPVLPLLQALRDDPSDDVRRSVANHLNDIAKDHPDLTADIARRWMGDATPVRRRLLRHACRTLIKDGHPGALRAFGLDTPSVRLEALAVATPVVLFGQPLRFMARIVSTGLRPQRLAIDYVVGFVKSNGRQAAKVFKWTERTLGPGEVCVLERSHAIRPITTRRYYAGTHGLRLRINGHDFGDAGFDLEMEAEPSWPGAAGGGVPALSQGPVPVI